MAAHPTVQYGMLSPPEFVEICHAKGIPVIVDPASEYDLKRFLQEGADLIIYSGHRFPGRPTTAIVAGRKDLVRAGYLQNRGIGRGMKVGKESVAGVMAALDAWEVRDHDGIRQREQRALDLWMDRLRALKGLEVSIVPGPTGNPLDCVMIRVLSESGFSAAGLAAALAACSPPVIVRNHEVERGHFFLDPCNLNTGEEETVAASIVALIESTERPDGALRKASKSSAAALQWPD